MFFKRIYVVKFYEEINGKMKFVLDMFVKYEIKRILIIRFFLFVFYL